MPYKATPDPRFSKKRKAKEPVFPRDGRNSGFAYRDSSKELLLKQEHSLFNCNEKAMQMVNLQPSVEAPSRQHAKASSLKPFTEKSLRMHMESVLNEVNEARDKLFQWWRQEIQAIVAEACERRAPNACATQMKTKGDCMTIKQLTKANGGHCCERGNMDPEKLGPGKFHSVLNACKSHVHTCNDDGKKACEFLSADHKLVAINVAHESAKSKAVNEQEQDSTNKKERQDTITLVNKVMSNFSSEVRGPLVDSCLGVDLGVNTKDVEGLDGTLESGVTVREGFESNKVSNEVQKNLDGSEHLHETKSSLFDVSFDDEESNEGNGVGCSLESAASSKVNSGFCKESICMKSVGSGAGFATCLEEHGEDDLGLNGGPEDNSGCADGFAPMKVKKEMMLEERKHAVPKGELVNYIGEGRLDDGNKQVETRSKSGSLKENIIGVGSLAELNQANDYLQQVGMGARSSSGVQHPHLVGMTFKGSVLECKPDVLQNANTGFVHAFNSTNPSIHLVKDLVHLPAGDKGRVALALPSGVDNLGVTGTAMSLGNMLTTSKNGLNQMLQDCKAVDYASRSRLGDAALGSGRSVDYPGFDPLVGYNSQFKAASEILDAYQQEQAAANPLYFSSFCTNNSAYLPTSNRVVSLQHATPGTPPSSGPISRPALMGVQTPLGGYHYQGHRNPSNMQSFLGLGMNGAPVAGNGMQVLSEFYLQNNQQHSECPYKNTSQSTSLMASHHENSAGQEKAIIELNF